jgi:hypothetical protein
MTSHEIVRTRGLPFSFMTTTHGLLVVADGEYKDLFTYCPERGVMRGLGDFDDRPRAYTPKCVQLFDASLEELQRMKKEWAKAARVGRSKTRAKPPFIPGLHEPVSAAPAYAKELRAFHRACLDLEAAG